MQQLRHVTKAIDDAQMSLELISLLKGHQQPVIPEQFSLSNRFYLFIFNDVVKQHIVQVHKSIVVANCH